MIILNVNLLNPLIKRHRMTEWIKNKTQLYVDHKRLTLTLKGHIETQSKGMGKEFHTNGNEKKPKVAILVSDKTDFKTKTVIKRSYKNKGINQ